MLIAVCVLIVTRLSRLSVCNALTSESLDLESSFFVYNYIFRVSRSLLSRLSGQGQGHRSKACLCILFVGGLSSIERQTRFLRLGFLFFQI